MIRLFIIQSGTRHFRRQREHYLALCQDCGRKPGYVLSLCSWDFFKRLKTLPRINLSISSHHPSPDTWRAYEFYPPREPPWFTSHWQFDKPSRSQEHPKLCLDLCLPGSHFYSFHGFLPSSYQRQLMKDPRFLVLDPVLGGVVREGPRQPLTSLIVFRNIPQPSRGQTWRNSSPWFFNQLHAPLSHATETMWKENSVLLLYSSVLFFSLLFQIHSFLGSMLTPKFSELPPSFTASLPASSFPTLNTLNFGTDFPPINIVAPLIVNLVLPRLRTSDSLGPLWETSSTVDLNWSSYLSAPQPHFEQGRSPANHGL